MLWNSTFVDPASASRASLSAKEEHGTRLTIKSRTSERRLSAGRGAEHEPRGSLRSPVREVAKQGPGPPHVLAPGGSWNECNDAISYHRSLWRIVEHQHGHQPTRVTHDSIGGGHSGDGKHPDAPCTNCWLAGREPAGGPH